LNNEGGRGHENQEERTNSIVIKVSGVEKKRGGKKSGRAKKDRKKEGGSPRSQASTLGPQEHSRLFPEGTTKTSQLKKKRGIVYIGHMGEQPGEHREKRFGTYSILTHRRSLSQSKPRHWGAKKKTKA